MPVEIISVILFFVNSIVFSIHFCALQNPSVTAGKPTACGARKNLRVAAATLLDFYRPLRFSRLASSAPAAQGSSTVTAKNAITWRFLNAASSPVYEVSTTRKERAKRPFLVMEHTGLEPVTPTLPVSCAPNCANAPWDFLLLEYNTTFFFICQDDFSYFFHFFTL